MFMPLRPLPRGLVIDPTTGVLSGTPETPEEGLSCPVEGLSFVGSIVCLLHLTVRDKKPKLLGYEQPVVIFQAGKPIIPNLPKLDLETGGTPTAFRFAPADSFRRFSTVPPGVLGTSRRWSVMSTIRNLLGVQNLDDRDAMQAHQNPGETPGAAGAGTKTPAGAGAGAGLEEKGDQNFPFLHNTTSVPFPSEDQTQGKSGTGSGADDATRTVQAAVTQASALSPGSQLLSAAPRQPPLRDQAPAKDLLSPVASPFPEGLTLDPHTGALVGTPLPSVIFERHAHRAFVVTAMNSGGESDPVTVTLTRLGGSTIPPNFAALHNHFQPPASCLDLGPCPVVDWLPDPPEPGTDGYETSLSPRTPQLSHLASLGSAASGSQRQNSGNSDAHKDSARWYNFEPEDEESDSDLDLDGDLDEDGDEDDKEDGGTAEGKEKGSGGAVVR